MKHDFPGQGSLKYLCPWHDDGDMVFDTSEELNVHLDSKHPELNNPIASMLRNFEPFVEAI